MSDQNLTESEKANPVEIFVNGHKMPQWSLGYSSAFNNQSWLAKTGADYQVEIVAKNARGAITGNKDDNFRFSGQVPFLVTSGLGNDSVEIEVNNIDAFIRNDQLGVKKSHIDLGHGKNDSLVLKLGKGLVVNIEDAPLWQPPKNIWVILSICQQAVKQLR